MFRKGKQIATLGGVLLGLVWGFPAGAELFESECVFKLGDHPRAFIGHDGRPPVEVIPALKYEARTLVFGLTPSQVAKLVALTHTYMAERGFSSDHLIAIYVFGSRSRGYAGAHKQNRPLMAESDLEIYLHLSQEADFALTSPYPGERDIGEELPPRIREAPFLPYPFKTVLTISNPDNEHFRNEFTDYGFSLGGQAFRHFRILHFGSGIPAKGRQGSMAACIYELEEHRLPPPKVEEPEEEWIPPSDYYFG